VRVTVFGGAGEIGGNQILVEGRESRIMLDFGRNFSRESEFFAEPFLKPRKLEQLLALELVPNLPGLYQGEGEPPVDGILLSHAHLDHMDYVRYVRQEVPVWAGETAWRIIYAREIVAPREEEHKLAQFKDLSNQLPQCIVPLRFPNPFRTGRGKLKVGEFEVTPIHVDHSIPGAYGFFIEGPEGTIAYTGDLRFHGARADMSGQFLEAAGGADVLIMEGTNVLESRVSSEEEVRLKIGALAQRTRGLLAASFSAVDIDRLRTFHQVAQEVGRELVISMRQACLMEFLRPEIESGRIGSIFKLGDPGVRVYQRGKEGLYRWERKLADQFGTVDSCWVSQNQSKVLLFATYYDMMELLSIKPAPGSVYIYSESEPWDEEGEIEFEKLANWLELLGLPMFQVHASGHASCLELQEVVERLKPKHVVVVHSDRPALFKKFVGSENIVCPERGKPLELA
jgi:ribonuclease J